MKPARRDEEDQGWSGAPVFDQRDWVSKCSRFRSAFTFGLPEAVDDYAAVADRSLTLVASDDHDTDIGFLTIVQHSQYSAEVYVMGVRPAFHRRSVGRQLLARTEALLVDRGVEYLQVKTLSERRPNEQYETTRAFYSSCGFRRMEEFPNLWGPDNPALQLVKRLK